MYAGMTTAGSWRHYWQYLMLTYANDAKLYVPVSSLHLISRYAGGAEENARCINLAAMRGHARGESGGKSA